MKEKEKLKRQIGAGEGGRHETEGDEGEEAKCWGGWGHTS